VDLFLGLGSAALSGVSAGLALKAPAAGGGGGTPAPAAGSTPSYGSSYRSGLYSPNQLLSVKSWLVFMNHRVHRLP
jgi:hypothetical protein